MKLFLDLEDTVIYSWQNPMHMDFNVQRIRSLIESRCDKEVSIFSFAIYDDTDKRTFETDIKPDLELALGVPIVEWLSVREMQAIVQVWDGVRFEHHLEFIQLKGKHNAFIDVCLARERDETCLLIDDCVPERIVIDHDKNLEIQLLPVDRVKSMLGNTTP